jgi:hypothetical protein
MKPAESPNAACSPKLVAEARNCLIELLRKPTQSGTLDDVRYAPSDTAELEALIGRFKPAVLFATHCFEPAGSDGVRLISGLTKPNSPVYLLREKPKGPVFALGVDGRPATSPPLAADFIRDHETLRSAEICGEVVLGVATVASAHCWRRWGLPAIPMGDLIEKDNATQREFWSAFNALAYVKPKKVEGASPRTAFSPALVVGGWRPATWQLALTPETDVNPVHRYVRTQAPQIVSGVGLWAPGAQTLAALQRTRGANELTEYRGLLQWSFMNELQHLDSVTDWASRPGLETEDLLALRARYLKTIASDFSSSESCQQTKQAYLLKAEELVAPMMRAASDVHGSEDAVLACTEAMLFRQLVNTDIDAACEQHNRNGRLGPENASKMCALADRLLKLHKIRQEKPYGNRRRRAAG